MIHFATRTLLQLLESRYRSGPPSDPPAEFRAVATSTMPEGDPLNLTLVTLFLYRVEVDPTKRYTSLPPIAVGARDRQALSLNLCYVLTVWSQHAETQQYVLGRCLEIFDRNAVISGDDLSRPAGVEPGSPQDPWESQSALKVGLDGMSHEDMMRLWEGIDATYRLSIPYVVRTIRLAHEVERIRVPPVDHRVDYLVPEIPR